MGASSSKGNKENLLAAELCDEKKKLVAQFISKNNSTKEEITQDKLKSLWKKYLTPNLLSIIIAAMYDKKLYILFSDIITFYYKSCEDTRTSEAEILLELCKISRDNNTVEDVLNEVVTEFIKSYFIICAIESNSLFNRWKNYSSCSDDVNSLTEHFTDSIKGQEINLEILENWINGNALFNTISHCIYKTIFNTISLEKECVLFPQFILKPGYSSILSPSELMFLHWNIGQKTTHSWRLLFCIDHDGESWATFLKTILAQGPTVIIIQEKGGARFGAFASKSWNINPNFYGDDESFLFTLHPKMNIFEATGYNKNFQYINTAQSTLPNGLGMGGVHNYWGLFLKADFGNGLLSETCTTFKNYKLPAKEKEFKLDKLQVWAVGAPDPTPEELGERTTASTSVLDKDPCAGAILELAGRTLHSTEIRKCKPVDEE